MCYKPPLYCEGSSSICTFLKEAALVHSSSRVRSLRLCCHRMEKYEQYALLSRWHGSVTMGLPFSLALCKETSAF